MRCVGGYSNCPPALRASADNQREHEDPFRGRFPIPSVKFLSSGGRNLTSKRILREELGKKEESEVVSCMARMAALLLIFARCAMPLTRIRHRRFLSMQLGTRNCNRRCYSTTNNDMEVLIAKSTGKLLNMQPQMSNLYLDTVEASRPGTKLWDFQISQ